MKIYFFIMFYCALAAGEAQKENKNMLVCMIRVAVCVCAFSHQCVD